MGVGEREGGRRRRRRGGGREREGPPKGDGDNDQMVKSEYERYRHIIANKHSTRDVKRRSEAVQLTLRD